MQRKEVYLPYSHRSSRVWCLDQPCSNESLLAYVTMTGGIKEEIERQETTVTVDLGLLFYIPLRSYQGSQENHINPSKSKAP